MTLIWFHLIFSSFALSQACEQKELTVGGEKILSCLSSPYSFRSLDCPEIACEIDQLIKKEAANISISFSRVGSPGYELCAKLNGSAILARVEGHRSPRLTICAFQSKFVDTDTLLHLYFEVRENTKK